MYIACYYLLTSCLLKLISFLVKKSCVRLVTVKEAETFGIALISSKFFASPNRLPKLLICHDRLRCYSSDKSEFSNSFFFFCQKAINTNNKKNQRQMFRGTVLQFIFFFRLPNYLKKDLLHLFTLMSFFICHPVLLRKFELCEKISWYRRCQNGATNTKDWVSWRSDYCSCINFSVLNEH